MIKGIISTLSLLLCFTATQAQTGWVNYKIDNKLSVKLPSQPTVGSDGVILSSSKDSTAAAMFMIMDFAQIANVDSVGLAKATENPDFVKGLTNAINKSDKAKFENFKAGKWHTYITYTSSAVSTDPHNKYYHMLMLIIGTKVYMFTVILSATADSKIKDYYFSSMTLN